MFYGSRKAQIVEWRQKKGAAVLVLKLAVVLDVNDLDALGLDADGFGAAAKKLTLYGLGEHNFVVTPAQGEAWELAAMEAAINAPAVVSERVASGEDVYLTTLEFKVTFPAPSEETRGRVLAGLWRAAAEGEAVDLEIGEL